MAENLTMIRHTSVITEITSDFSDLPEPETEEVSGTVSSVRLDSVVALCARLSRTKAAVYIEGEKVSVNGSCLHKCIVKPAGRRDPVDPRDRKIPVRRAGKSYEKGAYIRRGVPLQIGGYPYDQRTCKPDPGPHGREDYL